MIMNPIWQPTIFWILFQIYFFFNRGLYWLTIPYIESMFLSCSRSGKFLVSGSPYYDAFILNPLIWFWQLRTTNQRSRAPSPAGASTLPLFGIIWPLGEARVWRSRWDDGMIWSLGEVKVWWSRWGEGMMKIAKKSRWADGMNHRWGECLGEPRTPRCLQKGEGHHFWFASAHSIAKYIRCMIVQIVQWECKIK